mmetsp:Transcript_18017/g.51599  ORF Transcript_18017/g.51599 Transcript_18017/m.51599 type:complete len:91 (+) Transcript_18017:224-496(+)
MPPKKRPGKKREAPKPKTKADRKQYVGNRGNRRREDETPKQRKKRKTQSSPTSVGGSDAHPSRPQEGKGRNYAPVDCPVKGRRLRPFSCF